MRRTGKVSEENAAVLKQVQTDGEQAIAADTNQDFSLKESIFALIFSFGGFFFIKTLLFSSAGIAGALFMLCLCGVSMAFACVSKAKHSRCSKAYFAAAVIFSANIAVSSNGLIQFLDFAFAAIMYAMWAFAVNNPCYKGADDSVLYCLFSAVFKQSFSNMGKCPLAVLSLTKRNKSGQNIRNILIGLAAALPVTIVVAALLSSADDGFNRIMTSIFNGIVDNCLTDVLKYVFGLPLSFLMFGVVYAAVKNTSDSRIDLDSCRKGTMALKIAPQMFMYSSVMPLCVLYVIFFCSQISYFTSAFLNRLPDGFSASEYARQGFFELCAVAVINLAVIIVLNLFCKYNETEDGLKRPAPLKFLTVLVSVFTIVLIATAFSKMVLYISRYGLTQLRVYTSWFMVILAVLFVMIIVRQFRKFNFAKTGTVFFTVMLAALSVSQVDSLIVKYNLYAYESGIIEEFDGYALRQLSYDSVYAFSGMLESDDEDIRKAAEFYFEECYEEKSREEWYEKSLSEFAAENISDRVAVSDR